MEGYAEKRTLVYRHLEDPQFKRHFRMDKACFERLVITVHRFKVENNIIDRYRTETADSTLMGLWMLFNKDTFRSTGTNLGVSDSVIHRHYKHLLEILSRIGHCYIAWPNENGKRRIARYYERNFGFPEIVGAIDGTLVAITAPAEQKQRYVDRHHNYSISVQIVSDHKRRIRDISIGQPGSINDARVFRRSPLAKCIYGRNDMLLPDEHLVGDQGYVLTDKLLVPYRNDGYMDDNKKYFNWMLSQCRSTVERLNGLLKSRMGRAGRKLFCKSIRTVNMHIAASAVIHNFILLKGHEMDGVRFEGDPPQIDVFAAINRAKPLGLEKRNQLCQRFADRLAMYNE